MATTRREAHELLLIEEADAWFEYLAATRGQSAVRYKEVEPWAWARLSRTPARNQDETPEAAPRQGGLAFAKDTGRPVGPPVLSAWPQS